MFLYNREYTDNFGVFVARANSLISVTPKSAVNDLTKINPALNQQLPYGGASLMPAPTANLNRNRLINTLVVVTKGTSKGLIGVIKDVQGENARVELKHNNKTLSVNLASLKRKEYVSLVAMPSGVLQANGLQPKNWCDVPFGNGWNSFCGWWLWHSSKCWPIRYQSVRRCHSHASLDGKYNFLLIPNTG